MTTSHNYKDVSVSSSDMIIAVDVSPFELNTVFVGSGVGKCKERTMQSSTGHLVWCVGRFLWWWEGDVHQRIRLSHVG